MFWGSASLSAFRLQKDSPGTLQSKLLKDQIKYWYSKHFFFRPNTTKTMQSGVEKSKIALEYFVNLKKMYFPLF